jgi:hypothetical protein
MQSITDEEEKMLTMNEMVITDDDIYNQLHTQLQKKRYDSWINLISRHSMPILLDYLNLTEIGKLDSAFRHREDRVRFIKVYWAVPAND